MEDDLTIRLATADDTDALLDMGAAFYAHTSYPTHAPYCRDSVRVLIDMMLGGVLVVAESGGALVGMCGLVVTPFLFNSAATSAHEVMWWVNPEAAGKGVGKLLLSAAESVARQRGAVMMQMMHLPGSPPAAAALYERHGFVVSETTYTKAI